MSAQSLKVMLAELAEKEVVIGQQAQMIELLQRQIQSRTEAVELQRQIIETARETRRILQAELDKWTLWCQDFARRGDEHGAKTETRHV